jgi:O-antigen ligase
LGIALSASYLGGAEGWNQAIPVSAIGVLLIVAPLRALPGRTILVGLVGLILCAASGFLPGQWFSAEWSMRLRRVIPGLAPTLSLQPYQTLLWLGILLAAILYGAWLIQWQPESRGACFGVMVAGIAVLAGFALVSDPLRLPVPFWHPSQGFGPFANRNQTGTLMGLGAILAFGLSGSAIRQKKFWSVSLWTVAFAVCLVALLRSNSRASVVLLSIAIIVWLVWRPGRSIRTLAIGGGVVLLLITAALLLGEQVVGRFQEFLINGAGLRANIYQDTIQMIAADPLAGVGLGNFSAIFSSFRDTSLNSMRVIHPESDWLWLTAEAGAGSLLFCMVSLAGLFFRTTKPASRRERDILLAARVGIFAFLCNTFFDVPAHRLGTVLPALCIGALAWSPALLFPGKSWVPWFSRVAGIGLLVLSFSLLFSSAANDIPRQEFVRADWRSVEKKIDRGLRIAPLDWSFHLIRGSANVRLGNWIEAIADFRAARVLEPKLADVPFDEGCAWLGSSPRLVIAAWQEALNRKDQDQNLYLQMLDKSAPFTEVHRAVLRLADAHINLALAALKSGYADNATLDSIAAGRRELTSEQLKIVDQAWSRRFAAEGDYQQAYQLGVQVLRKTIFPVRRPISENECRLALVRDPADYSAAFNLCSILQEQNRKADLLQVLNSITTRPECPQYFCLMKGDLLASMNDWLGAWNAISELVR